MNEATRTTELETAKGEASKARATYEALKAKGWNKKTRDAAETLEFWTNRVSFLTCVKL